MKLHNSISANESQLDPGSTIKRSQGGQRGQNSASKKGSKYKSGSQLRGGQSTASEKKKHIAQSAKSYGKRSGVGGHAESRSPTGGTQTHGRNGGDPLDDPDYSLSVSEMNSNMGNSLMKSAARGLGNSGY